MPNSPQIAHLPKPPRAWLTLIVGGVLVLSGMVMGAGGTVLLVNDRLEQPDQAPKQFSRRLADRMTRDLGLTPEQESEIHTIFEKHQTEMHAVRKSVEQRIQDSFTTMRSEVNEILTPEQAKLWDERLREYRKQDDRGRPPRHEGGPPRDGYDGRPDNEPPQHRRPGDRETRDGDRPGPRHEPPVDGEPQPPRHPEEQRPDRLEGFQPPTPRGDGSPEREGPRSRPDTRPERATPPPPPQQ